jgi:membrane protein DedA with SNARE-associated domain
MSLTPPPDSSGSPETPNNLFRGRPLPKALPYVLFGIVVALTIVGNVTGGAAPELLKDHPLLLILGAPRYRWIMLVAPKVSAIPLILISWVRLLASDPVYFLIGWYYGDKAMIAFESLLGKQAMDTTRRYFEKATWILSAFAAGPIICALAGLARVNPKRFFTLDVIGTLMIAIMLRVFAEVLSEPLQSLIRFNEKYSRYLLIVTVAFMAIALVRGASKFKELRGQVDKLND